MFCCILGMMSRIEQSRGASPARRVRWSCNGFDTFGQDGPGREKPCSGGHDQGHGIGESVGYDLGENSFELVSGMHLQDWVHFNALTGGYDVTVERDYQTSESTTGRTFFRSCKVWDPGGVPSSMRAHDHAMANERIV